MLPPPQPSPLPPFLSLFSLPLFFFHHHEYRPVVGVEDTPVAVQNPASRWASALELIWQRRTMICLHSFKFRRHRARERWTRRLSRDTVRCINRTYQERGTKGEAAERTARAEREAAERGALAQRVYAACTEREAAERGALAQRVYVACTERETVERTARAEREAAEQGALAQREYAERGCCMCRRMLRTTRGCFTDRGRLCWPHWPGWKGCLAWRRACAGIAH